jgi:excisionase family DNA binding protein
MPRRKTSSSPAPTRIVESRATRDDPLLTIAEVCAELRIPRSTFYDWRAKGLAPQCITLPSRKVRIERSALEAWKSALRDAV